jgi:hypothetical protein
MRILVPVLAVLLVISSSVQAALPACASDAERQAMLVRGLQSYLMMAGVACNQGDAYNKFVMRNQRELSAQGNMLRSYFQRVYRGNSERHMNDFITELANAWSQVHMQNMTNYCKSTWDMMWRNERHPSAVAVLSQGVTAQPSVTSVMCNNVAGGASR